MDWYLDLWMEQPRKAAILMEILLLLIVAGILTCFILIRWRRACRKGKDREQALDEVLTELVDETGAEPDGTAEQYQKGFSEIR